MNSQRLLPWPTLLGILLMLALLTLEIFTRILGNVAYVAITAYALWLSANRKQIILLASIATATLVIGYLLAVTIHEPADQITFFVNRVSAIAAVWFACYFTLKYRKSQEAEKQQRQEIEERKLAEERLRSSQEMYESIARNFPEGWIGVLDKNLIYTFADGKGLIRTGIRKDDINGKKFSTVFKASETEPYLTEALGGKNVKFQINFNNRILEIDAGPLSSTYKTNQVLVVVHDITALKETETGLMKALTREHELNELQSRFVTMASHEFRTPLATIMSSSDLLASYGGDRYEKEKTNHIARIKQSVKLLTGILNDFLSLNKLEEGYVKPLYEQISLSGFLENITREVQPLLQSNQRLAVRHSGAEAIITDKEFLRNILHNLLSNAFKFSRPGAEVVLEAETNHRTLTIRITDYGIGIPAEDQHHIFTRFFRGRHAVNIQGRGLGLSIVKKYLDLLGGSIRFSSTHGDGTVFTVQVPAGEGAGNGE